MEGKIYKLPKLLLAYWKPLENRVELTRKKVRTFFDFWEKKDPGVSKFNLVGFCYLVFDILKNKTDSHTLNANVVLFSLNSWGWSPVCLSLILLRRKQRFLNLILVINVEGLLPQAWGFYCGKFMRCFVFIFFGKSARLKFYMWFSKRM